MCIFLSIFTVQKIIPCFGRIASVLNFSGFRAQNRTGGSRPITGRNESCSFGKIDILAKLIQIIAPPLMHGDALLPIEAPIVGAPNGIRVGVCE